MEIISSYQSILILNPNGFDFPIKWHRIAEWKKYPKIYCIKEAHLTFKDTCGLRVNRWKKILQANGS